MPASLASNTTTPAVLQITGLGQAAAAAVVERFVDANGNGAVDAGEFLAETFTVADGVVSSILGVRNTNIPGDEDEAANGQIDFQIRPALGPELGRVAGSHLLRISSPTGAFSTFTRTLAITQPAYGQTISGTVMAEGAPVPFAVVTLLKVNDDERFALGMVADGAGHFSLQAPPDAYAIFAIKSGYVANLEGSTPVVLGSGDTAIQEVTLEGATLSLSGKIADLSTGEGLGGVQLYVRSQNGLATLATSQPDGTYLVPVTAGQWQLNASTESLGRLGYLKLRGEEDAEADTTGGSVSGADILHPKASSLIHGTVLDANGNPLSGILVSAHEEDSETYGSDATTDAAGHYVLGVVAGGWDVFLSHASSGLAGYFLPPRQNFTLPGGAVGLSNFTMLAATAHLQGVVTKLGVPVPGIRIRAVSDALQQSVQMQTSPGGTFELDLVAGTWSLGLEAESAASFQVIGPSVEYTLGENQTISGINFPVLPATFEIHGFVGDSNGQSLSANVHAEATINGVLYVAAAQTDEEGNYLLPVVNGSWIMSVNAEDFTNLNSVTVTILNADATRNFILTKGPVITTQPEDQVVAEDQTFVFYINYDGNNVSFQWAVSTDGGTVWNDLSNDAIYNSVTSAVLNVTASAALDGHRYRCVASNSFGSATSESALLRVTTRQMMAWGDDTYGTLTPPAGLYGITAITGGVGHTLALKDDGSVVAWGYNALGQTDVPPGLSGAIAIAAGDYHSVALKNDGTVVVWGMDLVGQTDIPPGLTGVTAISANGEHTLALKGDGTVVAWGLNDMGQCDVPSGLSGVTAIAAGGYHSVALKNDGTVVTWGRHFKYYVPYADAAPTPPAGLSGVVAIDAGYGSTLALKGDGTVVAWGYNTVGQTDIPSGLAGVVAIAAGFDHYLALKGDGTVVAWGSNYRGQTEVPASLRGITKIGAGYHFCFGLRSSAVESWRQQYFGSAANSGNGADAATPDHDGISNLLKYGLVIAPGASSVQALPPAQEHTYTEGHRLALQFTRDPSRTDLMLEVQSADSLTGPWTTVAVSSDGAAFTGAGFVSETNASGGRKTVEVRDTVNLDAAPHRFMHIKVTR